MFLSNNCEWPNDLLEPVLITYNRASQLHETLTAFSKAGLGSMRLHVLDNASTDNTEAVVRELQQYWKNLVYHKNKYNIGGNANILRAVELSQSHYHWVIGDDDKWYLSKNSLEELIKTLLEKKCDVIRLGWLVSEYSRSQIINAKMLFQKESLLFPSLSMISATIFRRSLFTQYLPSAYQGAGDSYPQLVPFMLAMESQDFSVYTLSEDLMTHTPSQDVGYFCGDLEWYSCWFRTSRYFQQKENKSNFNRSIMTYLATRQTKKKNAFFWLVRVSLYYKSFGLNQWPYILSMFSYGNGLRGKLLALIGINVLIPTFFASWLRKLYFKLNRLPSKSVNVDRSRL